MSLMNRSVYQVMFLSGWKESDVRENEPLNYIGLNKRLSPSYKSNRLNKTKEPLTISWMVLLKESSSERMRRMMSDM